MAEPGPTDSTNASAAATSDDAAADGAEKEPDAAADAQRITKEAFMTGMMKLLNLSINGYPRAIRSTYARVNEQLRNCGGDQDVAVEQVKASAADLTEETKTWFIGLVPYVGFPAKLIYPTWRALRRVCLMAGLYGHDLSAEVTHAKIVHVFAGMRAVPIGECLLETAVQALWVALAGPVAGFLPVGVLASKVANVEGHVMGVIGSETFTEGRQPVPEEVYMEELDAQPTHSDYLALAKDSAIYAAVGAAMTPKYAFDVARDKERRDAALASAKDVGTAAVGAAVTITKGAVAAAPGAAAKVTDMGKEGLTKGLATAKGLLGGGASAKS
mmetsp:Transcript_19383/g.31967  ORF Transcript_19383/g.31967 Transcript_19383/m.31967 type:complete len:329 (-) Transcript_19383:197-1183(-)